MRVPIYEFKDKQGNLTEVRMHVAELDDYQASHPELERVLSAPAIGDPVRLGLRKPAAGFRDLLKHIHKRAGGNNQYHYN
jgi:hypothetical protein